MLRPKVANSLVILQIVGVGIFIRFDIVLGVKDLIWR